MEEEICVCLHEMGGYEDKTMALSAALCVKQEKVYCVHADKFKTFNWSVSVM